jgi:hypothetical protein
MPETEKWTVRPCPNTVFIQENGWGIGEAYGGGEDVLARAKLWAAAPDMLAALKRVQASACDQTVDAAIAKAEGGSDV